MFLSLKEWKDKLYSSIDAFYGEHNKLPEAIYLGYEEWIDYRSVIPAWTDIDADGNLYFEGIPIIHVRLKSYYRVV